jgi:hypothetical protein
MSNLLVERYAAGDREGVWRDLISLGTAVRHPLYREDAHAVAAETMKRARHNIESIVIKLEKLGYVFRQGQWDEPGSPLLAQMTNMLDRGGIGRLLDQADLAANGNPILLQVMEVVKQQAAKVAENAPKLREVMAQRAERRKHHGSGGALKNPDVFHPLGPNATKELDRFEKEIGGPIPLSLRQFHEQVGSVNLMGQHETINPENGSVAPDPLVIYAFRQLAEEQYGDLSEREDDAIDLVLAPDALHKANTSGGSPYAIRIPNAAADGRLLYEHERHTFVSYLRWSFQWGGFPGWSEGLCGGPPLKEYPKEIEYLQEGLLAI